MLAVVDLKKGEEYTFSDFVSLIKPYTEIGLCDIDDSKKLNLGMSNGLRALHDKGIIQLSHKLDRDCFCILPFQGSYCFCGSKPIHHRHHDIH